MLGRDAALVQAAIGTLDCRIALNLDVGGPMSGSLRTGLECVPDEANAAGVVLADMVNVTPQMLDALSVAAERSAAPLAASRYGAILAPPVLFRRALFPELHMTTGEGCDRSFIEPHQKEALFVDAPLAALDDVDSPEDYAKLR